MDDVGSSVATGDGGTLDPQQIRLTQGCGLLAMQCDAAAAAIDALSRLTTEEDEAPADEAAIETARRRLSMALAVVRMHACKKRADLMIKYGVFCELFAMFPASDPRLHQFAYHLVREMADLLDNPDVH